MVTRPIPVAGFEEFPIIEQKGNLPRRFESQAARHPQRIAIEAGQQSWTYRTLNESANRIAREILHTRASSDNPVALFFAPGFNAIVSILGVLKSGRSWVPILPGGPSERARALLMEAGSVLVLTDCDHIEEASTLASPGTEVVAIESVIGSGNGENLGLDITPDTASNIIFTSGSTSRPKGVVHTHTIILNNIMAHTNALYLTCKDRICQAASYTTLAGTSSIFRALLNGATLLPFETARQGPARFAQWLIDKRVTVCQIVPTLFRSMIQSLDGSGKSFPTCVFSTSAASRCTAATSSSTASDFPKPAVFFTTWDRARLRPFGNTSSTTIPLLTTKWCPLDTRLPIARCYSLMTPVNPSTRSRSVKSSHAAPIFHRAIGVIRS